MRSQRAYGLNPVGSHCNFGPQQNFWVTRYEKVACNVPLPGLQAFPSLSKVTATQGKLFYYCRIQARKNFELKCRDEAEAMSLLSFNNT